MLKQNANRLNTDIIHTTRVNFLIKLIIPISKSVKLSSIALMNVYSTYILMAYNLTSIGAYLIEHNACNIVYCVIS